MVLGGKETGISVTARPPRQKGERIRLRLLQLAYLAALIFCTILTIASIPARQANLQTISPAGETGIGDLSPEDALALESGGLSVGFYATYFTVLEIGIAALFIGVSILIFWAQPNNPMAVFSALTLAFFGLNGTPVLQALVLARVEWWLPVTFAQAIGLALVFLFFFIFPDGRFIPGWMRWLAIVWVAYNLIWPFFEILAPPGRMVFKTKAQALSFAWLGLWLIVGIGSQIHRYRRYSNLVERQQTRWVVFGLVTFLSFGLLGTILIYPTQIFEIGPVVRIRLEMVGFTLVLVSQIFLALTFTIAILRYRLFDINLIIRRTLVYTLLTGMLLAIYASGVILLQALLRPAAGQSDSPLAIVISTLLIAALFNPLRRRIQTGIDRRFFRQKYNTQQIMDAFAEKARNQADLDQLIVELENTLKSSMQPEHVQIWLKRN